MRKRNALIGLAVAAAGVAAGAALEEVVYRRIARRPDPEADESIGSVPGRTQWVESFDGTKLYARIFGPEEAKSTLVFAHGIVEHQVIWHYLIRDLRADGRYKLVAYDHRGHGHSGAARGPDGTTVFNGVTLAGDMAAVIHQAATGDVVTVGHSLGGMASLAYLTADTPHRERIRGTVLVNSTFTSQLAGWRGKGKAGQRALERLSDIGRRLAGDDAKRIERFRLRQGDLPIFYARLLFGRSPSHKHLHAAFEMFQRCPSQTIAAAIDLHNYDVHDLLDDIKVPTLIIAGSRDLLTPAFLSREMHQRITSSELVVLEGSGHMSPWESHDEITAHVRKFADKILA
jgi:pimeloyl-ACP methyl ester carboxylesterase